MSSQYICPSCRTSVWGDGYSRCATCIQTEVIRRGQEQQEWHQRQQQIQQENFQIQQDLHNNTIEAEARKQTQLLLEQNITESEAYQMGYEWQTAIPKTGAQHLINIYLRSYPQDMYIVQLQSAFLTPRLDKQYELGFWQRFEEEKHKAFESLGAQSDGIVDLKNDYVLWTCVNAGRNANPAFIPVYQFEGTEISARSDEIRTKLETWIDSNTGKMMARFDQSAFLYQPHATAYQVGLDEYLENANNPIQVRSRLDEINQNQRAWDELQRQQDQDKIIQSLTTTFLWLLFIGFLLWLFN